MTEEIAIIVCSAQGELDYLPGSRENCRDCGAPIFVSDCTRAECGMRSRPICEECGKSRFGESQVELTPLEEGMIRIWGGDELVEKVKASTLNEVEGVVRDWRNTHDDCL